MQRKYQPSYLSAQHADHFVHGCPVFGGVIWSFGTKQKKNGPCYHPHKDVHDSGLRSHFTPRKHFEEKSELFEV